MDRLKQCPVRSDPCSTHALNLMNETNQYILNSIRVAVWSGFCDFGDVQQMIGDILEEDADEKMLRAAVAPEFEKKRAAEETWPEVTDNDRLTAAFDELTETGYIALENAGYTMSDGLDDTAELWHQRGRENVHGYCFYHGQDVERAVDGGGLMLAYGVFSDDTAAKLQMGKYLVDVLKRHGLEVKWEEDPERRIELPSFQWRRRTAG